jgi:2-C-methyl-D-erythritol 4-phosphate cytidylyltransferase
VEAVVVVVEPGREASFQTEVLERHGYPSHWRVSAGGSVRQESVMNGMALVPPGCDVVVVHDGVRPFVTAAQIERAAGVAARDGACIVATPLHETIKRAGADGCVEETVDRQTLWAAQTPQCFQTRLFAEALARASRDGFVGTDEASLVERLGVRIAIVEGDARNIKITTPADLAIAESILERSEW